MRNLYKSSGKEFIVYLLLLPLLQLSEREAACRAAGASCAASRVNIESGVVETTVASGERHCSNVVHEDFYMNIL